MRGHKEHKDIQVVMDPNAADSSIQTSEGQQNEPIEELNDEDKKSEETFASENGPSQAERFNVNNENKLFLDMAVKLDKIQIIIKKCSNKNFASRKCRMRALKMLKILLSRISL